MKKICLLLMMSLVVVSGCAENSALIRKNSISTRSDVFEEPAKGEIAPTGFTDLRITGSLKTHKPGAHSVADSHGTPDYNLLLNIDGQATVVRGMLQKENSEPMKLVDPEAGNGVRYRFSKRLRLKAGIHRIVVAIPHDGIAVEKEVILLEGNGNSLVLEPVYCSTAVSRQPGAHGATNFKEGIRGIRLTLNGREI
jgi:hypothetical protein